MIPQEYIDKIYNKINKANLNNTLKIADDLKNTYNFNEFCSLLLNKCSDDVLINKEKSRKISELIFKYQMCYNNDMYQYNKSMLIDNFILELCTSLRSI